MTFPHPDPSWIKRIRRLVPIGDGWVKVFGFGPGIYPEISGARVLAVFKGFLYAGTKHKHGLQIWRTVDGASWYQCVGPKAKISAGFGNSSNDAANHMAILDNNLYVGTKEGVWISQDGDSWKQVSGAGISNLSIDALASFSGYVYAAGGKYIWRGKGTAGWEVVVGDKPPAKVKAGFGDPDITDITSLAVFDSKLYAGAGMDKPLGTKGIALWRTSDGTTWVQFQKETKGLPKSLHVHAMAPFGSHLGSHLYVGGYHSLLIYRTDGSIGSWMDVTDGVDTGGGNDGVWSIETYDGKLYLGATGVTNGKILWATTNGKSWTSIDTKVVGADKRVADALADFKGHIYMTTYRTYKGPKYPGEHMLEIWRYGPRWVPEDWLIKFVKPLLAHKPIIRVPPPPVWIQSVKGWFGRVIARIRTLIGRH